MSLESSVWGFCLVLGLGLLGFDHASPQDWLGELAVGLNSVITFKINVCKSYAFLFS